MAGNSKRKVTPKRTRVAMESKDENNPMKKKNNFVETIDLSSSLHGSVRNVDNKDEVCSQNIKSLEEVKKEQAANKRIDALDCDVKDMKEAFNKLSSLIVERQHIGVESNQHLLPIFNPMTPGFYNPFRYFDRTSTEFQMHMNSPMASSATCHAKPSMVYMYDTPTHTMAVSDTHPKSNPEGLKKHTTRSQRQSATTEKIQPKKLFSPTKPDVEITRPLVIKSTTSGHYLDIRPPPTNIMYARKAEVDIPFWLPILFKPPPHMKLEDGDIELITYIYGTDKDNKEDSEKVLVETRICDGKRSSLKTLMPKQCVDQDVIDLTATMATFTERSSYGFSCVWFLPTYVSQKVLDWRTSPQKVANEYQIDFMGKVENLHKIFIPINEENEHWFLLVVDIQKHQLILLDSKPCAAKKESRKFTVQKLALFLEEMLQLKSFYDFYEMSSKPNIGRFAIIEADNIGQQRHDSNDCGVWVATWMLECGWCDTYRILVNDATRMRLALDLVKKDHNMSKKDVIDAARKSFKKFKDKQENLVQV